MMNLLVILFCGTIYSGNFVLGKVQPEIYIDNLPVNNEPNSVSEGNINIEEKKENFKLSEHEEIVKKIYENADEANEICQWKIMKKKQPDMEPLLDDMHLPYFNIPKSNEPTTSATYFPKFIQYQKHFYIQLTTTANLNKKIPYYFSIDLYNEIQEFLKTFKLQINYWENLQNHYGCQKVGTFYGNPLYDLKTDIVYCMNYREGKQHFIIYQDNNYDNITPLKLDVQNALRLFMDTRNGINQMYLLAQKSCGYF